MNCEQCSKNYATYHLTAIENGKKSEKHLCEECARKAGMGFSFNASIADILGGKGDKPKEKPKKSTKGCPDCGMTYAEFRQKGRFGCPNDYSFFGDEIPKILEKIHGKTQHIGKVPKSTEARESEEDKAMREREKIKAEIEKLKAELETYIKQEAYEKAAAIRDQIRKMEAEFDPKK